jgi:predicted ArsR family transcriptional regulator
MDGGLRDVGRVALLREPTRRRLYEYVRSRRTAVSRDESAAAVGVSRGLAAFHLDRLADAGLLETEYRRLSGRTGRGAGRPAKLYRAGVRVHVSLPEARYELAGAVLVESLEAAERGVPPRQAVREAARRRGAELGGALAPSVGRGPELRRAERALAELGFEPRRGRGWVRPLNCPFTLLVQQSRDLVCSLNHALVSGLLAGLGCPTLVAEADPRPDGCCVTVRGRAASRGTGGRAP